MKSNESPFREPSVYIEQEETNKFKIQSDQLEQIGARLRGPRHFSIFQSIILPIIVTVATLIFTSLFQYVSWYNSVNLQNATDVAVNAERAYEKAAEAIGKRQYATFVFLPSLRDLVRDAKTGVETNTKASTEENGKVGLKSRKDAKSSPLSAVAIAPFEIPLHKSDLENKQQRFASYYKQLKLWNENYDHLLTDIDYALDRPVFRQVEKETQKTSYGKLSQIHCSNSLTKELERLQFNSDSLKLRFAGINMCFMNTSKGLDQLLTEAISVTLPVYNELIRIRNQIQSRNASLEGKCISLLRAPSHRLLQGSKGVKHPEHFLCLETVGRSTEGRGAKTFRGYGEEL